MAVKKAILDVLRNNDSTIDWIHIKSKHSENAIRVILNRELKPSNIVVETNDYKNKYKIYTLNTPKNVFKHLSWIRSRYIHVKWRIYEQKILAEKMEEFMLDSIESLTGLFNNSNERRKFNKAIRLRKTQRDNFLLYKNYFTKSLFSYEKLLDGLDQMYKNWREKHESNEIDPSIGFNQVFEMEKRFKIIINDFKKKENSHKRYLDNLKHPKF